MADLYRGSRRPGGRRRGRAQSPGARGGGAAEWLRARREEPWSRAGTALRAAQACQQHLTRPEEAAAPEYLTPTGDPWGEAPGRGGGEVTVCLDQSEARCLRGPQRTNEHPPPRYPNLVVKRNHIECNI